MVLHTGERWAQEAGDEPDLSWCPWCQEWVKPDSERDEDGTYGEWCRQCGRADLRDDKEGAPLEREDNP